MHAHLRSETRGGGAPRALVDLDGGGGGEVRVRRGAHGSQPRRVAHVVNVFFTSTRSFTYSCRCARACLCK